LKKISAAKGAVKPSAAVARGPKGIVRERLQRGDQVDRSAHQQKAGEVRDGLHRVVRARERLGARPCGLRVEPDQRQADRSRKG
jgi:hypothetical protein